MKHFFPGSHTSMLHVLFDQKLNNYRYHICRTWPSVIFSCCQNSNYHFVKNVLSRQRL